MKILITGSGGLVGTALTTRFSGHETRPLTHSDLDITNYEIVRNVIRDEQPDLVVNCAVIGVDDCEQDPLLAHAVNVTGPENLARAAAEVDATVLHFSTNYVFDGNGTAGNFYTVEDDPTPINIYGHTKLAGERAARAVNPRCFIIRTSWVFGVGKDNFFSTAHVSLKAGKRLRAITDLQASTTYVEDLTDRVAEIVDREHYATYHLVNNGVCSYYDFALETARILDVTDAAELIDPITAVSLQQAAKRPRYTPMRCLESEKIGLTPMRDWREALAEYILDNRTQ